MTQGHSVPWDHAGWGSVLADRVVGRDLETTVLVDALERAAGGSGGIQFIVGEPGIGKSRLAETVANHATDLGMPVLRGRAVEAATPLAYRPLAEALNGAVRRGLVSISSPVLASFRPILGLLVPEWRDDDPHVDDSVIALAEAVLRFLRVAGGDRGGVLVVEDAHWADPETLRVIEYLADNLDSEHVLGVVAVRDDRRSAGLELARALHARRVSGLVELSRLSPQDVAELVAACLRAQALPDDVLELAARADGIPFLVEEVLSAAVTSGALVREGSSWSLSDAVEPFVPRTFSDSVRRRLAALGERSRGVLVAAAVLGRRFDWSLLPAVARLGEADVLAALREAVDVQLISVDRDQNGFRFRHALSRDAVLSELLPPERARLSRSALETVEAARPELEDDLCELAAELAEGAGECARAVTLLLEAARRSLERGALASAEGALDRARRLLGADDTMMRDVEDGLVHVLSLAGKRDRAVEVGASLLAKLGHDEFAARRAEVYLGLARAALAATHWDEAHELVEQAGREIATELDEGLVARTNAVRAQVAIMRDPERAPALARVALEEAERLDLHDVACEALEVLGRSERPRDLDAAEAAFGRALAVAESAGLALWRMRALHELGTIDMLRGAPVTRLEDARNLALIQGALATAAVVDVQIAAALVFRDDPEPAAVATQRSAELARRYGLDQTLAAALALEAYVHARTGRRKELERCARDARARAPGVADVEVKIWSASAVRGFVDEDRAAVRRCLNEAVVQVAGRHGGDYSATPAAGFRALVLQIDGEADQSAASQLAERSVHFVTRAFFRYAKAVAAGRAGDAGAAMALVAEADGILGEHEWMRQLGHRLVAEAAVSDGWGDPASWLRDALAFFERRNEPRITSACRSLLRKAGAPVPRRRSEDNVPTSLRAAGITARELEVLHLLGAGLPNREIAARLYLSPRTVERHVENIAAKAGLGGRSELVAFAARTLADGNAQPT